MKKQIAPLLLALVTSTSTSTTFTSSAKAADPEPAPARPRVEWKPEWRKVAAWEVASSVALGAGIGAIILFNKEGEPLWNGGNSFEDPIRDTLRAETATGRKRAQIIGDTTYYAALAYPIVVDVVATAWLGHGRGDVAGQMLLMDLEAMSVSGFLSFVSNALLRRQRPYVRDCNKPEDLGFPDCSLGGHSEGFYSGHTAIAATTAGLTCAHHGANPLYGGGWGDTTACLATIAGAAVTGYTRLIADKHYLVDVVVGYVIGFASGYGFARYHYTHKGEKQTTSGSILSPLAKARITPSLGYDRVGFALVGVL